MRASGQLAVTPGEPAGIGPDLVAQLAQIDPLDDVTFIADPEILAQRAVALGLSLEILNTTEARSKTPGRCGQILVDPIHAATAVQPGKLNASNAEYVLSTLIHATDGCLEHRYAGLVTGPVQKSIINQAGIPFTGHTEFLAERADVSKVVMMLATEELRVALVTTHLPLARVPAAVTCEEVLATLRILNTALTSQWRIANPRILVAGLNPHAGEQGHLGREEIDEIEPAIAIARREGMNLEGPLPADTLFTQPYLARADAVLAMYHDQGLPVLKHAGFGTAVNITLGLPFVRTSVDHGTALDLAGSGRAQIGSLQAALSQARRLAQTGEPGVSSSPASR